MRLSRAAGTPILLATGCSLVWLSPSGCERSEAPSDQPILSSVDGPTSLRSTFDCLREWYVRGSYSVMRPYIDPTCRDDVIDLLIVVDELLAANAGARQAHLTDQQAHLHRAQSSVDGGSSVLCLLPGASCNTEALGSAWECPSCAALSQSAKGQAPATRE